MRFLSRNLGSIGDLPEGFRSLKQKSVKCRTSTYKRQIKEILIS